MPRSPEPAFPRPGISTNWAEGHHAQKGMTLRDYFAGQALIGFTSHAGNYGEKEVAALAYRYADAMLARREATT